MTTINNDASRFMRLVAQQFDQRHFSGSGLSIDFIPSTRGPSPELRTDLLPKDIQSQLQAYAANFSNWLATSLFLEPPLENAGKESVRKAAMEKSAKEMLLRLQQPLGYIKPYSEQLLTYVFQEAFNRAERDTRADERET